MERERLVTKPFVLLLIAHFLQGLGWTSMLLLPMYLESIGADRAQIGEVMAVGGLGGLLALPFAGAALDRVGRRPTLIAGTCCTVAGLVGLGFFDSMSAGISVMRFVAGVGTGTLFAGYFAFVADLIPASRRTEGIALFGISGLLPLMMNPFAEGLAPGAESLRYVFPVMSVGVLGSLPFIILIEEPVRRVEVARSRFRLSTFWIAQLRPVWVANMTFATSVAVFMAFSAVAASGAGMEQPSRLWIPYALGAIVVRLVGARLPDYVGVRNMVVPAIAIYAFGMLGLTWAQLDLQFLVAAALCGVGHGYCVPVIASQVVGRTPEQYRGSAMALSTGIWEASAIAAQPLFGAVADRHGDAWCFIVAAAFVLLGLVSWFVLELRGQPPRSAPSGPRSQAPRG